jgi:hypothetical protein
MQKEVNKMERNVYVLSGSYGKAPTYRSQWEAIVCALEEYIRRLSENLEKAARYEDGWGDEDAMFLSEERAHAREAFEFLEGSRLVGRLEK